ncbi:MAG: hypothetical protein ACI4X9_06845 [Kiritimatiellia bacterium]
MPKNAPTALLLPLLLLGACRTPPLPRYTDAPCSAPAPVLETSAWLQAPTNAPWRARRTFTLSRTPRDARLRLACGTGTYTLTVNGQPIRANRSFATRPAPHATYFDELPLILAKGTNQIDLLLTDTPRFICEILADGDILGSDHHWLTADAPDAQPVDAARECDPGPVAYWTDARPIQPPPPTATFTCSNSNLQNAWTNALQTLRPEAIPADIRCLLAPSSEPTLKAELLYRFLARMDTPETILALRDYWRWTGDRAFVGDLYPQIWRTLSRRRALPSGLWEPANRGKETRPSNRIADNIQQLLLLSAAAELAGATGRIKEAKAFAVARERLRSALARERRGDGLYAAHPEVNALAVLAGCSLEQRDFWRKHLLSAPASERTIEALGRLARTPEDVDAVLQKSAELGQGSVQVPLELVAGLKVLESAASRVALAPHPGSLERFELAVSTPPQGPQGAGGRLELAWAKEGKGSHARVRVPAGMTVEMRYPVGEEVRALRVDGELLWRRSRGTVIQKRFRLYGLRDGRLAFELPAGEWVIDASESTAIRPAAAL